MKLSEWLDKIQTVHVKDMDLGLERVALVAKRLGISTSCPVITVGGTNGKGSCVAGLEAIYVAAGYQVGAFTSPILFRHNEYIRIQKQDVDDEMFCRAFEKIESVRAELTLTPFEYNALAAFLIFQEAKLDVWILEVGLGGRWDAVNVIDADLAIIASIGIDHIEWLGDTREKIAIEKAGIFRSGKPAVCGDFDPPSTLIDYVEKNNVPLYCQNKQFGFEKDKISWNWWSENSRIDNLPMPSLALQNMSTVLMAVELLQSKLAVAKEIIADVLRKVTLTGRIQVFPGEITQIYDVSHNPASAEFLAKWLQENPISGKTRAVFSMLGDKDIVGTLEVIREYFSEWYIAELPVKRAAPMDLLAKSFEKSNIQDVNIFSNINQAHQAALSHSKVGDRIVVFGSFHTVAEISHHSG